MPEQESSDVVVSATEQTQAYDIRYEDEQGRPYYHIVLIYPSMREAFLKAVNSGETYNLNDFGTIVHSGWGEPSEALKQELFQEYGLTYDD